MRTVIEPQISQAGASSWKCWNWELNCCITAASAFVPSACSGEPAVTIALKPSNLLAPSTLLRTGVERIADRMELDSRFCGNDKLKNCLRSLRNLRLIFSFCLLKANLLTSPATQRHKNQPIFVFDYRLTGRYSIYYIRRRRTKTLIIKDDSCNIGINCKRIY